MTATTDKTYNGWTNYETWNVALWLDNDHGSYTYVRELAEQAVEDNDGNRDDAAGDLSTMIEEMVKDGAPGLEASTYSDLLSAALSEVNWYEIARNSLSED